MSWYKKCNIAALCISFIFVSCGEDNVTSNSPSDSGVYSSDLIVEAYDDLPVCGPKREGAVAYVKDEKIAYTCISGNWSDESKIESSASNNIEKSSSSVKKKSSSSSQSSSDSTQSSNSIKSSGSVKSSDSAKSSSSGETKLSSDNETKDSSNSEAKYSSSSNKTSSSSATSSSDTVKSSSSANTNDSVKSSDSAKSSSSAEANHSSSSNKVSSSSATSSSGTVKSSSSAKSSDSTKSSNSAKSSSSSENKQSSSSDVFDGANGNDGDIVTDDATQNTYKYDEAQKKWLKVNHQDTALLLGGCTTNRTGTINKSPKDDQEYVCKEMWWYKATNIDYTTQGKKCTHAEIGTVLSGVLNPIYKYCCTAEGWTGMTDIWNFSIPRDARLNPEITYGTMTDSRDGKTYKTVTIGNQVWMAQNLNYSDSIKTPSLKRRTGCYYNDTAYCNIAGRFYTWAAAIDSVKLAQDTVNPQICGYDENNCEITGPIQGICPDGWHLPSYDEWVILLEGLDLPFGRFGLRGAPSSIGGGKVLKSQTGWYIYETVNQNGNGTDRVGFSALPVGFKRANENTYVGNYFDADFWSADEYWSNNEDAHYMHLQAESEDAFLDATDKRTEFSIRCIKNSATP